MSSASKKRVGVTRAFKTLVTDADHVMKWLSFSYGLVQKADDVSKTAAQAILLVEQDPEKVRKLKRSVRRGAGAMKIYNGYRALLREFVTVRMIDSYLCYVTELLTALHQHRIEMLGGRSTVTLEEILNFNSVDDLHEYLIEKRVIGLSYKGIDELDEELRSKLGFGLFSNKAEKKNISYLVEVRNLLVHNKGKINHRFISKTNNKKLKIGQYVDLGDVIDNQIELIVHSYSLDCRARKKFKVKSNAFVNSTTLDRWEAKLR